MKLFNFSKKTPVIPNERIDYFYKHPDRVVDIEFSNRTNTKRRVWVEPTRVEFEIDSHTEFRIVTHDKYFRIEFDGDRIVFYLQLSFGFKLFKRPLSKEAVNPNEWKLDHDTSHIN
jgi:hypothetical protein